MLTLAWWPWIFAEELSNFANCRCEKSIGLCSGPDGAFIARSVRISPTRKKTRWPNCQGPIYSRVDHSAHGVMGRAGCRVGIRRWGHGREVELVTTEWHGTVLVWPCAACQHGIRRSSCTKLNRWMVIRDVIDGTSSSTSAGSKLKPVKVIRCRRFIDEYWD